MNKEQKRVLLTGSDGNGTEYFYYCAKCGSMNRLNSCSCGHCGKKRPRHAYDTATKKTPQVNVEYGRDIDRTARNCAPAAPNPCFAVPLPTNGNYDPDGYATRAAMNLPVYYATDEYGRVFRAKVSYGALPCSFPVPVATPSKHIQTDSINVPLN